MVFRMKGKSYVWFNHFELINFNKIAFCRMFQVQGRFERPRIVDGNKTTLTNVAALTAVAVKVCEHV